MSQTVCKFITIVFLHSSISYQQKTNSPTLLISLDAFRYDYLFRIRDLIETERGKESNFWRLIRNGSFAENGIDTIFATLTLPIHYSIATGLYEESHGVIGNNLYDPILNRSINLQHTNSTNHTWVYGGEPIWKTVQKQAPVEERGQSVGCIAWIGCEVAGLDRYLPFKPNTTLNASIDQAIEWLETGSRLVLIYHDRIDVIGHKFGPDSKEMRETLVMLDQEIGYLLKTLGDKGLLDGINLIVMSDHGILPVKRSIRIDQPQPSDMFRVWSKAQPVWLVEPNPGRYEDTVKYFEQFKHLDILKKQDIPNRWHYQDNDRIPPLIILAKPGDVINVPDAAATHGYDNAINEMRPTLIGHGPAFIPRSSVPRNTNIVDVYILLCKLLSLKPAPNNGSTKYFGDFIKLAYLIDNLPESIAAISARVKEAPEDTRHHAPLIVMAISITVTILILLILLFYTCIQGMIAQKGSPYGRIRSLKGTKGDLSSRIKSSAETESENDSDVEVRRI